MQPASVGDLLDEVEKVLGDILEALESHRVDGFDLFPDLCYFLQEVEHDSQCKSKFENVVQK